MSHKHGHAVDMCNGPLLPQMIRFAVPLMFSTILQLFFHMADIIVVGRFAGDQCMAAVGTTSSLNTLLVNLLIGFSIGANVQAARERGAGKYEDVRRTAHTAVLIGAFSGVCLMLIGLLGSRQFLIWMEVPESILDMSTLYLRILFLGRPASMVYNAGAALLRAIGDTGRPLRYLMISGSVNVLLNLMFVIGFGMDVAGVAIATVISNFVSCTLILRCLMREDAIQLRLRQLRIYPDKLQGILKVGIPASIQRTLFSIANVMVASSVNSFGELAVAGNSVSSNIESFTHTAADAVAQSALSFTSQNVGAGKWKRVKRVVVTASACVMVSSAVIAVLSNLLAPTLLGIYTETEAVIQAGLIRFRLLVSCYALCGLMKVMQNVLRGAGYSGLSTFVSLVGAFGVRIMWLLTVFQIPRFHTIRTVYMSFPVTWAATLAVYLICWLFISRRFREKAAAQNAET